MPFLLSSAHLALLQEFATTSSFTFINCDYRELDHTYKSSNPLKLQHTYPRSDEQPSIAIFSARVSDWLGGYCRSNYAIQPLILKDLQYKNEIFFSTFFRNFFQNLSSN